MNYNFSLLFPAGLIIIQTYLLLSIAFFLLKKFGVLQKPLSVNEISQTIVSAAYIFSVFYISTSDINPIFQAFKTFNSQPDQQYSSTFSLFAQHFLRVLFAIGVFTVLTILNIKVFLGMRNAILEVTNGNISVSIFAGVVIVVFGLITEVVLSEVVASFTPNVVIFN